LEVVVRRKRKRKRRREKKNGCVSYLLGRLTVSEIRRFVVEDFP
jgi:hypothetical protein